jgi:hypothetical protein
MKKAAMFCCLALFSICAQSAFYKCQDSNGQIRYSDTVCAATGSENDFLRRGHVL